MKSISIKTVAALIDATAHVEHKLVAIEYVTADGYLRQMLISKRIPSRKKTSSTSKPAKTRAKANVKMNGLIEVLDHTQGESIPKTLSLYCIIGFNPDGNLNHLFPVI